MHIAHLHLRERGHLTHVVRIIARGKLLKDGKVDLLTEQELSLGMLYPTIFAVDELNIGC